jgi:hypothetical protein
VSATSPTDTHEMVFKSRPRRTGLSATWRCSCGVLLARTANANGAGVRYVDVTANERMTAHRADPSAPVNLPKRSRRV